MEPEITVLMSVFNGEKYLRTAIDSILAQEYSGFEFMIIDDGSTDSSKEIILSFDDPRIRLMCNETNLGLTASLNRGLRNAKGKFIARMDADDISLPGRLKAQYEVLRDSSGVGVVSGWVKVVDARGRHLEEWREFLEPEDIYYRLFFSNCLAHGAVMFRNETVLRIGGYDETVKRAQDYELWRRMSKISRIYHLNQFVLERREHDANVSSTWKGEQEATVSMLARPVLNSLAGRELNSGEFGRLRSPKIDDLDELVTTIRLLEEVNRSLLVTEAEIIKNIGLKKSRIKKVMRKKLGDWLYLHLRPRSMGHLLRCFTRLGVRAKLLLLREIWLRITRKILR